MPGQDIPTIGLAFLAGLLSFISPCVLPLVPAYVSYLGARVTQQVAGELVAVGPAGLPGGLRLNQRAADRAAVLAHGLFFVFGFTAIFVLFGLAVNASLRLLGISSYDLQNTIARVGGVIVIFFGLHVMGVTGWLMRNILKRVDSQSGVAKALERVQSVLYADTRRQMNPRNPYGYAGSALMGVVFAAGWAPCTGPIYGSILTVALNGSMVTATVLLTAYSLGLGLPFLLTAVALDPMRGLLKRLQRHMRLIEVVSGLFLISMGYLLATNQLTEIAGRLTWLSDFSYNVEECGTGFAQGKVPFSAMGVCLRLGPDYEYKLSHPTVSLLIDGTILHVG